MKALIIGDCNSIHILNFIRVVLEDQTNIKITVFDLKSNKISNKEALDYYQEKEIDVLLNNGLKQLIKNPLIKKIPRLRTLVHLKQLNKKMEVLGKFDYCFIHFIDTSKVNIVLRNKHNFQRIVPVFWGSDLLRNRKIESTIYRDLFKISHRIVFNTENMKKTFNKVYGTEFESKSEVIKFPLMSFEKIDQLEKTMDKKMIKTELELPDDKLIVVCGHAGYKEEQYEELIASLSRCSESTKEKCYFVFLMTYGPSNLKEYQNLIRQQMSESSLDGVIKGEYVLHNEFLKLFLCTDIYITTITTDAFSGVMQENLYSGSIVMYGRWLNYVELENSGVFAQPIEGVRNAGHSLEEIVRHYDEIKGKTKHNKEKILNISSPKKIQEAWAKGIFEMK